MKSRKRTKSESSVNELSQNSNAQQQQAIAAPIYFNFFVPAVVKVERIVDKLEVFADASLGDEDGCSSGDKRDVEGSDMVARIVSNTSSLVPS